MALLEKKWVRYPAYLLFGVIVYFVALYFFFPDDEVKDIIEIQAEKGLKYKYDVKIDDVDPYWFTGLKLTDVQVQKVNEKINEDIPDAIATKFKIPLIGGRLSILKSIVNLAPAVQFVSDIGGGDISGVAVIKGQEIKVDASLGKIDLRKTSILTAFAGVPFFGTLTGDINLTLDKRTQNPLDGRIDIKGDKLTFGPATVKMDKLPAMAFIEVPQTNMGNLVIDMGVDKPASGAPELAIRTFNFGGRDLRGDVWGRFVPSAGGRGKLSLDLTMRTQFDSQYVTKNSLGPILNIAKVREGKNADWYGFRITGIPPRIKFKGDPGATSGPRGGGGSADAPEDPYAPPKENAPEVIPVVDPDEE